MKSTETKTTSRGKGPKGSGPDRLTLILVGLAIFLLAVAALLTLDILLSSEPDDQIARSPGPAAETPAYSAPPATPMATFTPGTPPPCVAPQDWGTYVVQEGDTLYSLAEQSGTDFQTLKRVNCLQRSDIWVGQELYVLGPLALPTFATATPSEAAAINAAGTPEPEGPAATTAEASVGSESESAQVTVGSMTPLPMPATTSTPMTAFEIDIPNRFINIVLLGTDVNFRRLDGTWRTDSIIIASVDIEDGSVGLLHVPRDLWVYIPNYGHNRINTADLWGELDKEGGGPERVKETIHHNLGIPIHYYVKMHREGFKEVVDTLGGVDIDVACPLPELGLEAGMHHLDGEMAYEFVHTRETSSDYDRGRRQRKMLMALWEQSLTTDIIVKLPQLWVSMGDTFETDIPMDQALNLARLGLQIDFQDIDTKAISGKQTKNWTTPEGLMVLLPREQELQILLEEFYAPDREPERQEQRSKVRLQVLNGTNRPDAEQLAASELKREGFKIVGKDIANRRDYRRTQIIVRRGDPAAGEKIARELGVPVDAVQDESNVPDPPNPSDTVDIRVILGKDYDPCQR